ncbi:hypothetical protein AAEY45_004424 [Yersinia enterocolitica]
MNEKPILFNAEMVNAILSGRKTQTRRIIKVQPQVTEQRLRELGAWQDGFNLSQQVNAAFQAGFIDVSCPLGKPGDQLWVRECFRVHSRATDVATLVYRASERNSWTEQTRRVPVSDCNRPVSPEKWTPSIHMPRWASRINLLITGVRVERLNDISEQDARAEGVKAWRGPAEELVGGKLAFFELWDSIYGQKEGENWQANPWVWVIEFESMEAK